MALIYWLCRIHGKIWLAEDTSELFIADVIAKNPISFDELKKFLPFNNVESIEFGFNPDWLGVNPDWTPIDVNEHLFFIKGDWNLPEQCIFPTTSMT